MDQITEDAKCEAIAHRRERSLGMAVNITPNGRRRETRRLYKIQSRFSDVYRCRVIGASVNITNALSVRIRLLSRRESNDWTGIQITPGNYLNTKTRLCCQ